MTTRTFILYLFLMMSLVIAASGCSDESNTQVDAVNPASASSLEGLEQSPLLNVTNVSREKLFEVVDSSGIDFVHKWEPPEIFADRINSYAIGSGVTIGDYDGDGKPDVFLACSAKGGCLYRNLGEMKFEDVSETAGLKLDGVWGTGCTFVDIDNDGDLDLYLCAFAQSNRLYVNQGDGTFIEQAKEFGLDYAGASTMMAFADYDRDGDLDAYLLTNYLPPTETISAEWERDPATGRLKVPEAYRKYRDTLYPPGGATRIIEGAEDDLFFENNGDGTFADKTVKSGIGKHNYHGLSATWFDYNGDRWPDLYIANDFYGPDQLYRNNGDGTFTDVVKDVLPHIPWFSMGADAADINNDGMIDLMAADMASTSHYRSKVTMGDMSDDGWFLDHSDPQQYMRNAMFINTGTEHMLESAFLSGVASTDWTWSVKFADFDQDGLVDLYITNGMSRDFQNSDLKYASVAQQKQTRDSDTPVTSVSFWEDQEVLREKNIAFHNKGDLRFEKSGEDWGLDHLGVSTGAALGDLDGDGDLDMVVNGFEEPARVYQNNTEGNRVVVRLNGHASNRFGLDAVVRIETNIGEQVRHLTLSRGYLSSDEPIAHFGLGDAERIDRLAVSWPSGHEQEFTDLEANQVFKITEPEGRVSVVAGTAKADRIEPMFKPMVGLKEISHRENEFDDFKVQPLLPNRMSRLGPGMAAGDVDSDGDDDLLMGGAAGQPAQLIFNIDGRFVSDLRNPFENDAACEDMGVLLIDVDGDADLDAYIVSGGYEFKANDPLLRDRLYLNDGQGRFIKAPDDALPDLRDSGGCVAAADFDRDGDLDIFVGSRMVPGQYPRSSTSRLLRNDGQGRFSDVTESIAAGLIDTGMVTSCVWSDVDDDGWIDLLVTHEWGPVKLFRNDQGRLFDVTKVAGLSKLLGWWNSIVAGDVDGDGDMDYAIANFGLNTKYHPSSKKPALIYFGDFEGDGKYRIVEAKETGNGCLPVRGKSCSQTAMPFIRHRFPTYNEFALAGLEEIYSDSALSNALKMEANELRSGVLLNDGEGRFEFRALPTLAQIAPIFGMSFVDVNADGHLDLFAVQNFYSPQRETGHMDGGLGVLMLGNGDGTFESIWPAESGLIVPGDAKSLLTGDFSDERALNFIVGRNSDTALGFAGVPDRDIAQFIEIQLKDNSSNFTGIGARVELRFDDGRQFITEVRAGEGYLSQNTASIWFPKAKKNRLSELRVRWPNGVESNYESWSERGHQITIERKHKQSLRQ